MPVLYVDIDSLRPDHVGAYGYEQPTTPNIDRLAEESIRFDRAYAANSPCMPSRAAFTSGRYGLHNGIVAHGPLGTTLRSPHTGIDQSHLGVHDRLIPIDGRSYIGRVQLIQDHLYEDVVSDEPGDRPEWDPSSWWTLPELFFTHRIRTAAVSSFPRHPATWFYHLWHEFHQPQEPAGPNEVFQTPRADTVADIAVEFIDRHDDEEFFLYAQFWEPHAPYNRPDEEIERFADGPLPPHPTDEQIAAHREWDAQFTARQLGVEDRTDLRDLLARYDAEIRYVDDQLGRLFDALRRADMYEDALIVVTADHGEEFGEHGVYVNHPNTHDQTQRVPLIVKPPADEDSEPGGRDQFVTNVDMAPTIADYAGLDQPSMWQGRSLRPLLSESGTEWRDRIVVDHGSKCVQRTVRTDRWKLIRTYDPGAWGDYWPDFQLYDMTADPWEQEDRSGERPDVVEDLEREMLVWAERHAGSAEDATRALARTGSLSVHEDPFERSYTVR